VSRLIDGYGDRVQDSVFEVHLTDALLDELAKRLEVLIDLKLDMVSFYRVCALSQRPFFRLGQRPDSEGKRDAVVFVV